MLQTFHLFGSGCALRFVPLSADAGRWEGVTRITAGSRVLVVALFDSVLSQTKQTTSGQPPSLESTGMLTAKVCEVYG